MHLHLGNKNHQTPRFLPLDEITCTQITNTEMELEIRYFHFARVQRFVENYLTNERNE